MSEPTPDLVEDGVRAYARGDLAAAERSWARAIELDPSDERARAYLDLLARGGEGEPVPEPVHLPQPSRRGLLLSPAVEPASVPQPGPGASPWDEGPSLTPTIQLGEGGGLDLAAVAAEPERGALHQRSGPELFPPQPDDGPMRRAWERFALGDFSGALELSQAVLREHPGHEEADACSRRSEATLLAMFESKLGPPSGVPRLAIGPKEVMWLDLDHRAGFLLAQVDGTVSYDDLFALSSLPRLETARILAALLAQGVIAA